jgi:phosphonopyruvate decarboxylase
MKRFEAIRHIAPHLTDGRLVVCCNGALARELYVVADRPQNFYLLGGTGLAAAVGLGLALHRTDRTVVVIDGDANVLTNLGGLGNVADAAPENLYHLVIDNGVSATTGGQRSISDEVAIEEVAWACGYARAERVEDTAGLDALLRTIWEEPGPAMILVRVEPDDDAEPHSRIDLDPPRIAQRFVAAALEGEP